MPKITYKETNRCAIEKDKLLIKSHNRDAYVMTQTVIYYLDKRIIRNYQHEMKV